MKGFTHTDTHDDPLAQLKPEDFDGHTVFADLTPAQRLEALGHMTAVVATFKGLANTQHQASHSDHLGAASR